MDVASPPPDAARDRPSSLGGQYEKLLATVGNLQGDLQRTVGVCQSLGSQNDKLKSNYEAVRTELVQLREKHNTTRKQLLEAVESRVSADQRTETLVHKWKVQLEARTKELESLQAKLVPQDLDMLRAKVQEELEVPQQRRVALLEAEVEKHRQMFCKARREHERCKAEYEQYTIDQGREMEAQHQQHKVESHALKMRVQDLEGSFADASRDEEGRLLRRQLDEAEAAKSQLHDEMAAVRSKKEAAELERHKLVLAHQTQAAAAHVQISTLDAEKKSLQRRCTEAEEATERRRRQAEDARDKLQDALEEVSQYKEACAGKDRVALEARSEARHAAERLAAEWGREKAELKAANEALAKRITLAERRSREMSEHAANRVRAAQQLDERVRRETGKEVDVLRELSSCLEAEVERLRLEGERAASGAQQEIQRLRRDADLAKSEASRTLREKEALRERVAMLQSATDRAAEAAEEVARDRDEARLAVATAGQRVQQERDGLAEAEGENEGLRARLQMVEGEMAGLVAEADQARRNHLRALKEIRRAAGVERDSHVASVQFELEAFRRRAGRSIRKERKRSRAYKAQAIEAHKRGLRARHVLETRANAMTAAAEAGLFARRGNALGAGRGREQMDSTSSTFGAIFDGTTTDAAKTMEALELSEALQRVRTSRRGQSDKEPERRVAHDTETRPQPGLERKGLETIGRGALPGRASDGERLAGAIDIGATSPPTSIQRPDPVGVETTSHP
eukprot:jgi/Undpi1/6024/HiC_scaffold_2.g01298.m1